MSSERSQIKMVFDSIYIEFKTKQNESTGLEVRKVLVWGDEAVSREGLIILIEVMVTQTCSL